MEEKRIKVMEIMQDYFCRDTSLNAATESIMQLFNCSCSEIIDIDLGIKKCLGCGKVFYL